MNGPDELRELADEMDADKHSPEFFAAVTRTAADAWEEQLADAWASFHRAVGRALNTTPQGRAYLAENAVLRKRLDAAEKAWAEFKEHYPWIIQPWDDMQMTPEAVGALERLAVALAGEEK